MLVLDPLAVYTSTFMLCIIPEFEFGDFEDLVLVSPKLVPLKFRLVSLVLKINRTPGLDPIKVPGNFFIFISLCFNALCSGKVSQSTL